MIRLRHGPWGSPRTSSTQFKTTADGYPPVRNWHLCGDWFTQRFYITNATSPLTGYGWTNLCGPTAETTTDGRPFLRTLRRPSFNQVFRSHDHWVWAIAAFLKDPNYGVQFNPALLSATVNNAPTVTTDLRLSRRHVLAARWPPRRAAPKRFAASTRHTRRPAHGRSRVARSRSLDQRQLRPDAQQHRSRRRRASTSQRCVTRFSNRAPRRHHRRANVSREGTRCRHHENNVDGDFDF